MKNFGKLISVLLCIATVLSIISFVSCSDNSGNNPDDDDQTDETPKYTVAVSLDGAPYVYKVEDKVSGICIDILANIAEKNKVDLELKLVDGETIISGLMNGDYPYALAPADTYIDEDIAKNLVTSQVLVSNKYVVLVSDSSKIHRLYDLAVLRSKKIGILEGSAAMRNAIIRFGEENVITYSNYTEAVAAVNSGEINALVVESQDNTVIKDEYLAENSLKVLPDDYYSIDYVVFAKEAGEGDLNKTDEAISELVSEKKIEAIVNEYILGNGTKTE